MKRRKSVLVIVLALLLSVMLNCAMAEEVEDYEIKLENEWQYLMRLYSRGDGVAAWAQSQAHKYGLELSLNEKIPVLMYHHIIQEYDGNSGVTISTETFEKHMEWLHKNDWQSITVEDLYLHLTKKKFVKPNSFVITFDDGYESNYLEAYPILKKYGFNATEYLIGNRIENDANSYIPNLDWEQTEVMSDAFDFGNHTFNMHFKEDGENSVLGTATYERIHDDLSKMDALLEEHGYGVNFKSMAFPYGRVMIDYSEATLEVMKELGIKIAFTTEHGYADFKDELLQIDRFSVFRWTSVGSLANYMEKSLVDDVE